MRLEKEFCFLCRSNNIKLEACGMCRCLNCHFFFLSQFERDAQQASFSSKMKKEVTSEMVEKRRRKYNADSHKKMGLYEQYANRFLGLCNKRISALDIGASGGFFLSELEKRGSQKEDLETLEFDPIYASLTEEVYGYTSHVGNIEEFTAERQFDLITMFDVLEHVDDFWHALDNMHKMLSDGGRLFLKLPNGRWAYLKYRIGKLFGVSEAKLAVYLHVRPGGHLNYWDVHTLPRLEQAGYELESFEYVKPTRRQFGKRYLLRLAGYWLDRVLHTHLFPEMVVIFKKK